MFSARLITLALTGLLIQSPALQAKVNDIDKPLDHPAIPLLDEDGKHVLESGKPYSPRKSCAGSGCHDYDKITSAYHFEMGRDEGNDNFGKFNNFLGAKSLVSPGWFGGFNCMGGSIPTLLANKKNGYKEMFRDYGAAGFIDCSSCHVGGGFGEKDRHGIRYTERDPATIPPYDGDYYNRGTDENNEDTDKLTVAKWDWHKSGLLEADCMWCHVNSDTMTLPDERMKGRRGMIGDYRSARREFISEKQFRYAANTIWEFVNLNAGKEGEPLKALTVEREWDEEGKDYTLKKDAEGKPIIHWNPVAFDDRGRIHVKMMRFAETDNCMACHRTSNSRRGFYGYGDDALAELDPEDQTLVEDYKDDVHKGKDLGKYWQGESRIMDNCNVCHSRGYFKGKFENINLDQDHNFLKGHSDMDIRNDLDFADGIRTCEYCHVEGQNARGEPPVIPSKQPTLLAAHLERWKNSGYMLGYPQDSLEKVVQTHFRVLNCQTCHITNKKGRGGKPLQIMYRYRDDQNHQRKIVTYNPRLRYLWIDTTTGWALPRFERGLVVQLQKDADGNNVEVEVDGRKRFVGDIIDPETGEKLPGQVTARVSYGSLRIGDPLDADGYRSLKKAYDKLMKMRHGPQLKGRQPDVKMVWMESNEYIISHNVRPAVSALDCGRCHDKKQDGSFSSLLSQNGVLGDGNRKEVTTLPDPKLVQEGVVVMGMPYMKLAEDGTIYENENDILFATLVDPFMTVNDATNSRFVGGYFKKVSMAEGIKKLNLKAKAPDDGGPSYFVFAQRYGKPTLRNGGAALPANTITNSLAPKWRVESLLYPKSQSLVDLIHSRGFGDLASDAVRISVLDENKNALRELFGNRMIVKLPYRGRAKDKNGIEVLTSVDGLEIHRIDPNDIIQFIPRGPTSNPNIPTPKGTRQLDFDAEDGYVLFYTNSPGYFAVADL